MANQRFAPGRMLLSADAETGAMTAADESYDEMHVDGAAAQEAGFWNLNRNLSDLPSILKTGVV